MRGLDYYTRTIFEFTSDALGAQSGVGGGGRYDGLVEQLGGAATPGMGWAAGVERMLLAARAPPARRRRLSTCTSRRSTSARAPSRWPPRRAAPGSPCSWSSPGRSLKGQLKQADRARRPLRCHRRRRRRPCLQGHGVRRAGGAARRRRRRRPRPARAGTPCEAAAAGQRLPRRVDAATLDADARGDAGPRRRLGAPPPRPRRADLHRPARPLRARAARLPPGRERRRVRAGRAAALRARGHRAGQGRAPRAAQRQPEHPDRRDRDRRSPRSSCSPSPRRRRSRSTRTSRSTRCCACSTAPLDLRRDVDAATHGAAPPDRQDDARRPRRARLPRDRDADPHALDARGRARLPRAQRACSRAPGTRCRSRRSCSSSC